MGKKNSSDKSIMQIWKEADEWDDYAHELFGRVWNRSKIRRIELLERSLVSSAEIVKGYNYYDRSAKVTSLSEARELLKKFEELETIKSDIQDLLLNFDRTTLESIKDNTTNLESYVKYYDWYNRLMQELEKYL